jgi:hypothetical protein
MKFHSRIKRIEEKLGREQERSILVIRSADPDEEPIVFAYGFSKEEREELQAKYAAERATTSLLPSDLSKEDSE